MKLKKTTEKRSNSTHSRNKILLSSYEIKWPTNNNSLTFCPAQKKIYRLNDDFVWFNRSLAFFCLVFNRAQTLANNMLFIYFSLYFIVVIVVVILNFIYFFIFVSVLICYLVKHTYYHYLFFSHFFYCIKSPLFTTPQIFCIRCTYTHRRG